MGQLVPEQRFDKNNKLVTRHVRVTDDDTPQQALPAPKIDFSNQDRQAVIQARLEARYAVEDYDETDMLSYHHHFQEGLHLLDERTARLIQESVTSPHMSLLCIYLVSEFSDRARDIREVLYYRDANFFATDKNEKYYNFSDEAVGLVRGIREMPEFQKYDDLSLLPESEARQVSALLRVGYAVYSTLGVKSEFLSDSCKWGVGSSYPLRITDTALVQLVMERPLLDEAICSLIRERGRVDVEMFREALNDSSQSLISGAL